MTRRLPPERSQTGRPRICGGVIDGLTPDGARILIRDGGKGYAHFPRSAWMGDRRGPALGVEVLFLLTPLGARDVRPGRKLDLEAGG